MRANYKFRPMDPAGAGKGRVTLRGRVGEMARRGLERLHAPEFNEQFLIADLDFNQERWFTNYSGDISGRFLECMTLAGEGDVKYHSALAFMLEHIPQNQREEGCFGIQVDFGGPVDYEQEVPRMMPLLWGNARMLPALVEAWIYFQDKRLLESARRLGDFYVNSERDLMNPERLEEYRATGTYAPGYSTCYFPAMEALVRLWEVTGEEKYLRQAERMGDFRRDNGFDRLPVEHSHGYLCAVYGLLLLYCARGEEKWLEMARQSWQELVEGGYILPTGGLLEKAVMGYHLDEGCSQADWMRVNLLFFALTGEDRYADMAERVLHNQLRMNQCNTGGFGHRRVLYDGFGPAGYGTYLWEALWCCDFHVATALTGLQRFLLMEETADGDGGLRRQESAYKTADGETTGRAMRIPFLLDFQTENEWVRLEMEEMEVPAGGLNGDRKAGTKGAKSPESQEQAESLAGTQQTGAPASLRKWKLTVHRKEQGVSLWLRIPDWAGDVSVYDGAGRSVVTAREGRWLDLGGGEEYICAVSCPVMVESRRFGESLTDSEGGTFVLRQGPDLLAVEGPGKAPAVIGAPRDDMEQVYVFRAQGVECRCPET